MSMLELIDALEKDALVLACEELTRVLQSGQNKLTVLKDVSLSFQAGETAAIIGPSGSGKSTLLGLLAGLDRATSGDVILADKKLGTLSESQLSDLRRMYVGFVFQDFQLLNHLTAKENVLLPLELAGHRGAARQADEILEAVGLSERGHHYPSQLSGGEKQRVAIARACAPEPKLLLADEPTGNLDPATGEKILDLLIQIQKKLGMTLILVTHDLDVAGRMDRQIRLHAGEVISDQYAEGVDV